MLIGELSQHASISTRMLRHYDQIGLVSPSERTSGGYREYSPDDVHRLFQVESLRSLGLPLGEVKAALDDPDFAPSGLVDRLIVDAQKRISREQELLERLQQVRASAPVAWTDVLRLVTLLRGLNAAEPTSRLQAAMTLGDAATLPATSLVQAVLQEEDVNVAGALQWALARSGDEALPILEGALNSADQQTRRRALATIVKVGSERAFVVLRRALSHADGEVRSRAAIAIGATGDEAALPELLAMVVRGIDDVEAAEAIGAVARIHHSGDQIAGLIDDELLRPEATAESRARLTQALAELEGPVVQAIIAGLADDTDPNVRRIATYHLQSRTSQVPSRRR